MVNWRQWNLMDLFKRKSDLLAFLAMSLPETTVEEQLHLYELSSRPSAAGLLWSSQPGSIVCASC